MVRAIALLPNQKLDEGFDEIRRMYGTDIQNVIGPSENDTIPTSVPGILGIHGHG